MEPTSVASQQLRGGLSLLRVRELFGEVHDQVAHMQGTSAHTDELIEAMLVVAADGDLESTLRSIMVSAAKLVDAKYGALAVRGAGRDVTAFVHPGLDGELRAKVGPLPAGQGVLELLIEHPCLLGSEDVRLHRDPLGVPLRQTRMMTCLGTPIRVRNTIVGSVYLTEKNGDGTFTRDDAAVIEALASAAAVAVDNAWLYDESQSRLGWIEATCDIRAELLAGADIDVVLGTVARKAMELTDGHVAFIARPRDPEQPRELVRELVVAVAEGECVSQSVGRTLPVASTSGAVFSSPAPFLCDGLGAEISDLTTCAEGPALVVPLNSGDTISGVLVVARRTGQRPFTQGVLALASNFAEQTASAMSMAATNRRTHELEVIADRDRIARDLHDHVIQRVFAAGMSLQGTLQRTQSPDVRRRLTGTIDDLQDVVQEIRATIFDLQNEGHETTQLRERIHDVIDNQTGDSGVKTYLRLCGPLSVVRPELSDHVVAVVREAVSNGVRHAAAETITVTISVDNDLTVAVIDDGIGMPAEVVPSGLANLRSRARELGGDLTLSDPATGSGLVLSWFVPL